MMLAQHIIKDIENYFSHYCDSNSDQMLYYSTKYLLDYLRSFEIVKEILHNLKEEFPYTDNKLDENQNKEGFLLLREIALNKKHYVSYVLQFLEYTYKTNTISNFYNDVAWICYSNEDYDKKDRILLFKKEVIKPICDYVIEELRKNVSLLYILDRYKIRTMRFETPYEKGWTERNIQDKLALYLFDCGYSVHREENLSNGKPDFLFSDEDNNQFIIEVKYLKKQISYLVLWKYASQLRDYMNKKDSTLGVLYIFTTQDTEYQWENAPNNMRITTIYVGDKSPCKRNTKTISIDFDSPIDKVAGSCE